jgi:signal transduction histidine kinase
MSDMPKKQVALDLLVAVGTVGLATVLKAYLVDPIIDIKDPFALYIAAVALTAWWGWRWAALSIVLAALAGNYFFVPPLHSFHADDPADRWLLVLFVGEASLIAWLVARLKIERQIADHAVALRDRFVATVSHDLRTPLQTILAWAQTLRDHHEGDGTRHTRALHAIQRAVEQQQRLIEDLLDFSVAAQGKLQIHPQRLELGPFVSAVVEAWTPQCEQRGLVLKAECAPERLEVEADADRLRQVIGNLLSNSVKFTARGGSIRVEVAAAAGSAVIRVVDSGAGIPAAMLERIFESWQQEGPSGRGGVGLGLAITRHLVELHDGTIQARSEGRGHGTTVEIRLPRAA